MWVALFNPPEVLAKKSKTAAADRVSAFFEARTSSSPFTSRAISSCCVSKTAKPPTMATDDAIRSHLCRRSDQFHFIALSWLVLKMTGDPLALGAVMAIGGIPRAIFTLIGGAITDRISPRQVMLISDAVRLLLSAL